MTIDKTTFLPKVLIVMVGDESEFGHSILLPHLVLRHSDLFVQDTSDRGLRIYTTSILY